MQQKNGLKTGAYISFGVFILLLIGAFYYWKERMFFADASYIALRIINEKTVQIQQYRFGAFITQIVPVIAVKLGLSVKSLLIAYSAAFHVFYLFVAAVLLYLKNYRLLVLYAFYWTLVTTQTFFWPNNEVHQGIAYMFLLFPILAIAGERKYNFSIPVILLLILGTTAVFCHPLVLTAFLFLWVYQVAEKQNWHYNIVRTIILSSIVLLIVIAKLYVSHKYASYESDRLPSLGNLRLATLKQAVWSPFAKELFRHVISNYWILPIVSIIGIVTLVVKRRFLLAVWTLGCTGGYFLLLCLSFDNYNDAYIESEIMTGIIIAAAPFAFETLPRLRKEVSIAVLLFIFVSRFIIFHNAKGPFAYRYTVLAEMLGKAKRSGLTKVVLVKKDGGTDSMWMLDWGFPSETMLLSASMGDNPVHQIALVAPGDVEWLVPKNNVDVIHSFGNLMLEQLNQKYIPFDTTRPYTVISYEEFMK